MVQCNHFRKDVSAVNRFRLAALWRKLYQVDLAVPLNAKAAVNTKDMLLLVDKRGMAITVAAIKGYRPMPHHQPFIEADALVNKGVIFQVRPG